MRKWWLGARPRTLPAALVPVVVGTAAAHPLHHVAVVVVHSVPPGRQPWPRPRAPPTRSSPTVPAYGSTVTSTGPAQPRRLLVARPRRAGRGAGHPDRHQLRQRLLGRHPGDRRRPGRPGPADRHRPGLAGSRQAGRAGGLRGGRRGRAWRWPGPPRGGSCWSERPASWPAGSTPAAPGPTATPAWARSSSSCSSAWWPPSGPSTCETVRLGRPAGVVAGGGGRPARHRAAAGQQPAGHRHRPASGKRTLAVRVGRRAGGWCYVACVGAARSSASLVWGLLAVTGVVALPLAGPGVPAARRRSRSPWPPVEVALGDAEGRALLPVLAATGRLQLAFGATAGPRPVAHPAAAGHVPAPVGCPVTPIRRRVDPRPAVSAPRKARTPPATSRGSLEVGSVVGPVDHHQAGRRPPMRVHQPPAELGELGVPAAGHHQHRHGQLAAAVPQRLLGAGPGQPEARGEARRRVALAARRARWPPSGTSPNIGLATHRSTNAATVSSGGPAAGRVEPRRPAPRRHAAGRPARPASSMPGGARHEDQSAHEVGAGQGQVEAEAGAHRVAEVVGRAARRRRAARPRRPGRRATVGGAAVAGQVDRHELVVVGQVVGQSTPHPAGLGEAVGQHQAGRPVTPG